MRIRLFLAIDDAGYLDHLTRELSVRYSEVITVTACSNRDHAQTMLTRQKYDVILLDEAFGVLADQCTAPLVLFLWDSFNADDTFAQELPKIRKYQRVSSLVSQIQEHYASVAASNGILDERKAQIVAVWSPFGGCGKTTIALAFAAQKVSQGYRSVYLDLEPFSSVGAFFPQNGRGLSVVLEKMNGNVEMLLQSIRQTDTSSGILYYGGPDNYEDINILTAEEIKKLLDMCTGDIDILIVDLGSGFDEKTAAVFNRADEILLVTDGSKTCETKLAQFRTQNKIYESVKAKVVLIANKGSRGPADADAPLLRIPMIESADPVIVYKTLSASRFD